jgi:hypothetical protein
MLKIKKYKYITNSIKSYFNKYLFDIESISMNNKYLFIIKNKNNDIIGSFFINTQYKILETIYIIEKERGKGYCSQIINYLKKNYISDKNPFLYFDVDKDNVNAVNCYKKQMKYVGILEYDLFYKIYGFKPKINKIFIRYCLS